MCTWRNVPHESLQRTSNEAIKISVALLKICGSPSGGYSLTLAMEKTPQKYTKMTMIMMIGICESKRLHENHLNIDIYK